MKKHAEVCHGCRERLTHNAKIMLVRITHWSGTAVYRYHYRCGMTVLNTTNMNDQTHATQGTLH